MLYILVFAIFTTMFYASLQIATRVGRSEVYIAHTSQQLVKSPVRTLSFTKKDDSVKAKVVAILKAIAYRFTPLRAIKMTENLLVQAGQPRNLDLDAILAVKTLLAGFVILASAIIAISNLVIIVIFKGIILAVFAFFIPDIYLAYRISVRKQAIRKQFPDFLDLLAVSVQAGIGFDLALKKLTASFHGPLVDEFKRMLKEIQLGISRKDAFRNLADRVQVSEINAFVQSMLMADSFGVSIAKILKQKASEMRVRRRQHAEEIAMKAPVKMLFPLIFFIFPVLLIVILGPAMIRVYLTLF